MTPGVVPHGVGEDNTLPVRLRVGWNITPNVSVHLLGGVVFEALFSLSESRRQRRAQTRWERHGPTDGRRS